MAKILSFLRLTAKFLAVLRLTVNPIETLFSRHAILNKKTSQLRSSLRLVVALLKKISMEYN